MRRVTLLFATLVAIVGLGAPAMAVEDVYPPQSLLVTLSDDSPDPGTPFDVTVTGCSAHVVIEFEFDDRRASVQCAVPNAVADSPGDSGAATQRFIAPNRAGTFSGTVLLTATDAEIGTFQIDVSGAVLASLATDTPLAKELSWTPGMFSLGFLVLIGVAAAVGIRLRVLGH
jgi:hypothetical protein